MNKKLIIKISIILAFFIGTSLIFVNYGLTQQSCPENTVVGQTSATLVGEILDDGGDPNLTVWFQYGETNSYGLETSHQSKNGPGSFCDDIYNLNPCTVYHFRAVAQNSVATSYGSDRTFTTQCLTPNVDIKADNSDGPITIPYNSSASLTWTSNDANSCNASGSWSGTKPVSGSESTGNLTTGTYVYNLTCSGPGGSANDSVTVNVSAPPAPTVDLKANNSDGPITLTYQDYLTLSWTSSDAVSCQAEGDWSGTKSTSGSEIIQLLSVKTYTFTLICQNSASQTSQDSVQVIVEPKPPVVITKPAVVTL